MSTSSGFRTGSCRASRGLLEAELPEVLDAIVDAGALRMNRLLVLPEAVTGGRQPGDERFDSVTARRPLVEAAFARAAAVEPGVDIRRGVAVTALVAEQRDGAPPHIAGVVTSTGERIDADLVVDAGGRRSALPDLLEAAGAVRPNEWRADSGFAYFVRNYHRADGTVPAAIGPPILHYDSVSVATMVGEAGTWSIILVASAKDAVMRKARDVSVWERIVASYPLSAHWLDGEPVGDVDVIVKIEDRIRRLVVDGQPVATGIVAVADAVACTDPSLGRGASISLLHVCLLRDLLRETDLGSRLELVRRWDECTQREIMPVVEETLRTSAHRLAQIEAQIAGVPYAPEDPSWSFAQSLAAAARSDPVVLRAMLDVAAMVTPGADVAARPDIRARIAAAPPARAAARPRPRRAAGHPARPGCMSTIAARARRDAHAGVPARRLRRSWGPRRAADA